MRRSKVRILAGVLVVGALSAMTASPGGRERLVTAMDLARLRLSEVNCDGKPVNFWLVFAGEVQAKRAGEELGAQGFDVRLLQNAGGAWHLVASKAVPLSVASIRLNVQLTENVAVAHQGHFEQWEVNGWFS